MLLDEIATRLEADGVGTVKTTANDPAWPIQRGGLYPGTDANPDDAIALIEGVGDVPLTTMGSTVGSVEMENAALVVHVRSMSYATARSKAEDVWRKLHRLSATLSGVAYLLVMCRQQPFPVGRDDAGRWIIGFNADVAKVQS